MLWWFERNGQRMHVEVLHLPNGGGYELHIFDAATGAERTEYFVSHADLTQRQQMVVEQLVASGWSRSGEWLL